MQRFLARPEKLKDAPAEGVIQTKLAISQPGDEYEQEADRVSAQVMRTTEPQLQRACTCGGECPECRSQQTGEKPESLQRQRAGSGDLSPTTVPSIVQEALAAPGHPLDSGTRRFMEPRFGHDFSAVRIHTDARADAASAAIRARAFTVGADIVFRRGELAPHTQAGRALLAHELTHVVQQRGKGSPASPVRQTASAGQVQRKAPTGIADPLCGSYDSTARKMSIEGQISDLAAAPDVEKRLALIRSLKWIWRCGTEAEKSEIKARLEAGLGKEAAAAMWKEAGAPLGGYRGVYPGYYSARGRLERLGVSEVEAYDAFAYDPRRGDAETFKKGRETTATAEAPVLTATDLLYFYGHQYAQYRHPGVFANGTQTQFIDLRALAGKGVFSRVKLIVSTSCATCCKEAVETFSGLFPNAVILGYRKSAPTAGEAVRNDFDKGIRDLKRPLLLEEPVDVEAIIGVWKSVVERHHPKENSRLPAYYQGGTVHYLEMGAWRSMPATDAGNSCKKKGGAIEEATH